MSILTSVFTWVMGFGCPTDVGCNTFLIDNFFLEMCEKVEYCITKEIDKGTEYVIRVGNQTYVMIYGD